MVRVGPVPMEPMVTRVAKKRSWRPSRDWTRGRWASWEWTHGNENGRNRPRRNGPEGGAHAECLHEPHPGDIAGDGNDDLCRIGRGCARSRQDSGFAGGRTLLRGNVEWAQA